MNHLPGWFTEEKYLEFKEQGMSDQKICDEILFISVSTFKRIKTRLGLVGVAVPFAKERKKKQYAVRDRKSAELVFLGTSAECADFLGITLQSMRSKMWREKNGERHGKCIVSPMGKEG